jgi:hypothetical protein
VKKVRTTHRTLVFATFFTLWRKQFLGPLGDRANRRGKVTVEKTPKRAGATPLFRLSAAQKVRGVAPALRHGKSVPHVFSTVTGSSEETEFAHARREVECFSFVRATREGERCMKNTVHHPVHLSVHLHDFRKSPLAETFRRGDGCATYTRNPIRHRPRHPTGDARLLGVYRLRMARHLVWTREKHRTGLERPHF